MFSSCILLTNNLVSLASRFDKIIAKEFPASIVYEDEKVLVFRDINPQAPIHVVLIPQIRDGLTQLGKVSHCSVFFSVFTFCFSVDIVRSSKNLIIRYLL